MSFPIIGIGSSAGGLEPLQALIRAVPEASGLAFVIVAHLDPTQKSHLPELLARCTAMPVMQVEETTEVRPDHVYVIGPDQDLSIEGGALHTKKSELPRGHRHPVDVFFRSLAETLGATLHLRVEGENAHHMVEGCFKAVARSLRQAFARQGDVLPSTKGAL